MNNIVVGTAGHIDHGKTALVRALTGIDTDRLEEEKRRGISIDLGFAHLQLGPELRVAFVDVPGHERFIKNMLAGIGGIDLLMLAVAADASVQPQTREHFDICRLLGIEHGFVALTKTDIVDRDIVELVRLEVEDLVEGSFLEGAPIVPCSAATGDGLEQVKAAIVSMAGKLRAKNERGHFRLAVDRSFPMRGFGTVVTGTLLSGSIAVEDEVEVHPAGRRLRVRGLQVHGKPALRATAGQRTALNLAGAEHTELARGMVVTRPGVFRDTRTIDCMFTLLASAKPLKHRAPVHFHSGTAEIEAEVRRLEGSEPIAPGSRVPVRFVLREPSLLLAGDRFIVRMFSPVVTIGGGVVLDPAPPRKSTEARVRALDSGTDADRVALLVSEAPFGMSLEGLVARTALTPDAIGLAAKPFGNGWYLAPERAGELIQGWRETLAEFHRQNPLLPGMPKEQLRGRTPAPVFEELLRRERAIVIAGDIARLATHRLALQDDEAEALGKIEAAFERAGLKTPGVNEVLAASGVESARARSLLQILVRDKKLVRISEDLVFHRTALASLRALMSDRKGQSFGVGEFKEWTGISRKYAIPLLEMLDRERVTRRDGDRRTVL